MGLFSRNKEAVEAGRVDEASLATLRRSPRNTRTPRSATAASGADAAPLDPADTAKSRARRRLIGAIALALAAIVFVPMLFDRTPVAPADDIALQIPDRDTPFEGRRGVPDPARAPLKSSSDLPTPSVPAPVQAEAMPAAAPDTAAPVPEPVVAAPSKSVEVAPSPKPTVAAVAKAPAPVEKAVDKPKPASPVEADDPRALAALEGKPEPQGAATPAGDRQYVVQIAAFSTADRARGLRDQLVASGLKSYTESVSTAQGLRTRVRLGPYPSREAADRAKLKLKTMKLDGSVVPL